MKNNITKILLTVFSIAALICLMAFNVSAEQEMTEGKYTYYISAKGECIITKADSSLSGDVVIPAELGGAAVTEIGRRAFEKNANITSVKLPETLIEIEDYAFVQCTNIESITIPDNVTFIGSNAFSGCESLKNVTLGKRVTTISDRVFYECLYLEEIVIPDSVVTIGSDVFSTANNLGSAFRKITIGKGLKIVEDNFETCKNIETIIIDEENPYLCADSSSVLYSKDKTMLLRFPSACTLEQYTIPDGVKKICDKAFYKIRTLKSVAIPDTVTEIGTSAFHYCSKLESIKLSDKLVKIGENAFSDCISLKEVKMPDTVTKIGESAFYNCNKISKINLSESLQSIGKSAFEKCSLITDIVIPDTVKTMGSYCFDACKNLRNVTLSKNLESIPHSAFGGCENLTEITIPGSAKVIDNYAFKGCKNMTKIIIEDGVEAINLQAFDGCSKAVCKVIPDSVKVIQSWAFDGCSAITSIMLSKNLEEVQRYAFKGCNIQKLLIPKSIDKIGDEAFGFCYDFYYEGTEEEWKNIILGKSAYGDNDLTYREIKYNTDPDDLRMVGIKDTKISYKSVSNLNTKVNVTDGCTYTLTYESSDPSVATVDENGNVTAVSRSETIITCKITDSDGYTVSDTCKVTVNFNFGQWLIYIFLFGWIWY